MVTFQLQSSPHSLMGRTPAPRFMEKSVGIPVYQAMPTPINAETLTHTLEYPADFPKRMFKTRMMKIRLFFIETQITVQFQNLNFRKTATVVPKVSDVFYEAQSISVAVLYSDSDSAWVTRENMEERCEHTLVFVSRTN